MVYESNSYYDLWVTFRAYLDILYWTAHKNVKMATPSSQSSYKSQVLHADLAATDAWEELSGLERLGLGGTVEGLVNGCQPETVLVREVVTGTLSSITLDEGSGAEILQTRAWRHQRLTTSFISSCRMLCINDKVRALFFCASKCSELIFALFARQRAVSTSNIIGHGVIVHLFMCIYVICYHFSWWHLQKLICVELQCDVTIRRNDWRLTMRNE